MRSIGAFLEVMEVFGRALPPSPLASLFVGKGDLERGTVKLFPSWGKRCHNAGVIHPFNTGLDLVPSASSGVCLTASYYYAVRNRSTPRSVAAMPSLNDRPKDSFLDWCLPLQFSVLIFFFFSFFLLSFSPPFNHSSP